MAAGKDRHLLKIKNMPYIKIKASVSESRRTFKIDIEDTGYTLDEWNDLSDDLRAKAIGHILDNEPDQPYWVSDSEELITD